MSSELRREGGHWLCDQTVNGLSVRSRYRAETVETIFLPLLRRWTSLPLREGAVRRVVFLAAPPAAGKSTLAGFLQALSEETEGVTTLEAVGMDGFHRFQEDLLTHTTVRDGKEIPLASIKGAPETFDLEKLRERIQRLRTEAVCPWPCYDRLLHNPVEGGAEVRRSLVLLEGNYLLLDRPGWRELRTYCDDSVRILAEAADVRERLIERKARSGLPRREAEAFVDRSDLYNVRLCEHMLPANCTLRLTADGDYEQC